MVEQCLTVDFNEDDDDDVFCVRHERFSHPAVFTVGQPVRLSDHEGNVCLGEIIAFSSEFVWVRADYSTWRDRDGTSCWTLGKIHGWAHSPLTVNPAGPPRVVLS